MRKRLKSAVTLGVIASLFVTLLFNASAAKTEDQINAGFFEPAVITGSYTLHLSEAYAAQADFTVDTYEGLIETVARQYVARDTEFSVQINNSETAFIEQLGDGESFWGDVFTCDLSGTISDTYYLWCSTGIKQMQYTYDGTKTVCEFTQTFLTTAAEEAYVDSAVENILESLNLDACNTYEKIKAIHEYIVSNVEYDTTYTNYSAYEALYSGETVCNGYALLSYKMLSGSRRSAKIITGTATSGGETGLHAWNVVKIGPWWYNLDVTWNDGARTTDYFLKNEEAFSDHSASTSYPETVYEQDYDISPVDFDPSAEDVIYYDPADISLWAREEVVSLIARGVVPVSVQSNFQNSITRAEFTALMAAIYEYAKGEYALESGSPFIDISESIFAGQIEKGYTLGLISGYEIESENGVTEYLFKPEGTLTREQCAKIISDAAGIINGNAIASDAVLPFGDTASISSWALMYVRYAFENGLMNGMDDGFKPQGLLTREQAMLIAERMIEKYSW